MTTTKTSGKKYQVLILAEPKPEEADPRIEFYQSPRFVCENNCMHRQKYAWAFQGVYILAHFCIHQHNFHQES